jgi:hypothetical protein
MFILINFDALFSLQKYRLQAVSVTDIQIPDQSEENFSKCKKIPV